MKMYRYTCEQCGKATRIARETGRKPVICDQCRRANHRKYQREYQAQRRKAMHHDRHC